MDGAALCSTLFYSDSVDEERQVRCNSLVLGRGGTGLVLMERGPDDY